MLDTIRGLTTGEIALAKSIYGNTIDYSAVRISSGTYFPLQDPDRAVAPNGNIYFGNSYVKDLSSSDLGSRLTSRRLI